MSSRKKQLFAAAIVLAASMGFTSVFIRNYIFPLGAITQVKGDNGQDCGQMIWNLWHSYVSVTSGRDPYRANEILYPNGANLAHHTLAPGFFPVTIAVRFLSGNDPSFAVYTYRIVVWLSFSLILAASFLFLRELGFDAWPAALCSISYAFCPFFLLHVIHINHLAAFFVPLTALSVARFCREPSGPRLLVVAFISAVAVYFTEFALFIYMVEAPLLILSILAPDLRRRLWGAMGRRKLGWIAASLALFLLLAGPFALKVVRDPVIKPSAEEVSHFSANLAGFIVPSQENRPLYGELFSRLHARVTRGTGNGTEVFLGFPLLLLAIAGLGRRRSSLLLGCAAGFILFVVLSLGPTLKLFDNDTGIPLPYALLRQIPPFDDSRTPVRFVVMAIFFLMVPACAGLTIIQRRLRDKFGRNVMAASMLLISGWVIAEAYAPTLKRPSFTPPDELKNLVAGPVLNLPLGGSPIDGYSELLQVFHKQPIVSGYLARTSLTTRDRYDELRLLVESARTGACERLEAAGIRNIILNPTVRPTEPQEVLDPAIFKRCSLNVVDLRERNYAGPGRLGMPTRIPVAQVGRSIEASQPESEDFFWYGWSGPEPGFRWSEAGRAAIAFRTGETPIKSIKLRMLAFMPPSKYEPQHVTIELNGKMIAELLVDEEREYSIAIPAATIADENVLTFLMPDVKSPHLLGLGEDRRALGIMLRWFQFE